MSKAEPNIFIDGHTKLVALLGWPVEHSFSPALQNAAFMQADLNYCYVALPVPPEQLGAAVAGLRAINAAGWNVTIPHKQTIITLLDEVSADATVIGAVNCVVNRDNRLYGYNTDVAGFMAGLREAASAREISDAVVLGAGGSARAVVWGLAAAGIRVLLLARREEQALALAQSLQAHTTTPINTGPLAGPIVQAALAQSQLLVNTTPLGMWPRLDASPLPKETALPGHLLVYDLIYNPRATRLLQQAQTAGCQTQDGMSMLVNQGAEGFRRWTGVTPDTAVMKTALELALNNKS